MKRIIYIYCLLILISCDFSEKKVYKNLYIITRVSLRAEHEQ